MKILNHTLACAIWRTENFRRHCGLHQLIYAVTIMPAVSATAVISRTGARFQLRAMAGLQVFGRIITRSGASGIITDVHADGSASGIAITTKLPSINEAAIPVGTVKVPLSGAGAGGKWISPLGTALGGSLQPTGTALYPAGPWSPAVVPGLTERAPGTAAARTLGHGVPAVQALQPQVAGTSRLITAATRAHLRISLVQGVVGALVARSGPGLGVLPGAQLHAVHVALSAEHAQALLAAYAAVGVRERVTVVSPEADAGAGQAWLAPWTGAAQALALSRAGRHTLLVVDDLTAYLVAARGVIGGQRADPLAAPAHVGRLLDCAHCHAASGGSLSVIAGAVGTPAGGPGLPFTHEAFVADAGAADPGQAAYNAMLDTWVSLAGTSLHVRGTDGMPAWEALLAPRPAASMTHDGAYRAALLAACPDLLEQQHFIARADEIGMESEADRDLAKGLFAKATGAATWTCKQARTPSVSPVPNWMAAAEAALAVATPSALAARSGEDAEAEPAPPAGPQDTVWGRMYAAVTGTPVRKFSTAASSSGGGDRAAPAHIEALLKRMSPEQRAAYEAVNKQKQASPHGSRASATSAPAHNPLVQAATRAATQAPSAHEQLMLSFALVHGYAQAVPAAELDSYVSTLTACLAALPGPAGSEHGSLLRAALASPATQFSQPGLSLLDLALRSAPRTLQLNASAARLAAGAAMPSDAPVLQAAKQLGAPPAAAAAWLAVRTAERAPSAPAVQQPGSAWPSVHAATRVFTAWWTGAAPSDVALQR